MKLLFQKSLRSGARKISPEKTSAEAVLLSTDLEMTASIVVANDTLVIEKAEWESLRSGSHYVSCGQVVPQLHGAQAYFGVAAALARAFPDDVHANQRALFAECIKAVIQSECYLYQQRGFTDSPAYQADWDASHPNSCRYYSHLERVERRWFGYIGDEPRDGNLFHRHKNIAIWHTDQGALQSTGSFLDSFHELGVQALCEADGRIVALNGGFLRAPDLICFGTKVLLTGFVGRNVREVTRKEMNRCVGGPEGCAHLLDLTQELFADLQKTLKGFDGTGA